MDTDYKVTVTIKANAIGSMAFVTAQQMDRGDLIRKAQAMIDRAVYGLTITGVELERK